MLSVLILLDLVRVIGFNKTLTNEEPGMKKQYFSKIKKRWIDFKVTDCEVSLRKCGYRIREVKI